MSRQLFSSFYVTISKASFEVFVRSSNFKASTVESGKAHEFWAQVLRLLH